MERLEVDSYTQRIIDNRRKTECPKVFINYRYKDIYAAATLDHYMTARLGQEAVFFASRSIPPGAYYPAVILAGIEMAKAMLVIVGRDWSDSLKRGDHDWTRLEIQTAQARGLYIMPVLLDGAVPPSAEMLPATVCSDFLEVDDSQSFRSSNPREDSDTISRHLVEKVFSSL